MRLMARVVMKFKARVVPIIGVEWQPSVATLRTDQGHPCDLP